MALNTNYQAEVGISFNDTKLRKQIETIQGKTISLDFKVKGGLGNLDKALKDTNKLLKETDGLLKSVNKSTGELDKTNIKLEKSTKDVGSGLDNTAKKAKQTSDAFNHTANHGKNFSETILDISKKVLAFGGVTEAIGKVRDAMAEAVQITRDFDDAMVDFKKVSDISGVALEEYAQKLGRLGEDVYRTRKHFCA